MSGLETGGSPLYRDLSNTFSIVSSLPFSLCVRKQMIGHQRLWILATYIGATAILWILIPKYTLKNALVPAEVASIPNNTPISRKGDLGFKELVSGQDPVVEYVRMVERANFQS
jgi:hypothetical protein